MLYGTKRHGNDTETTPKRQVTAELQAHSKALEDQTTNAARDVAILNDRDKEYARQGQAKNKEVRGIRCRRHLMKAVLIA